MVWKPRRSVGGLVGFAAILLLGAVDWLLLSRLRGPISLASFFIALAVAVSVPFLALLGYWLYGFFSLRYRLDRNALTIIWGATRQIVPMASIQRVVRGEELEGEVEVEGVHWPGYWVGHGQVEGIGLVLFYATRPLAEQLLVVTPTLAYGISPDEPEKFLRAFELRRRLGPLQRVSQESRQPGLLTWPIWQDRLAHLLVALGLLANAALFAYLCWRYPTLPAFLPLHFDALGQTDRIAPRSEVFKLPFIGLLTLTANCSLGFLVHRGERFGSYLLLAGAVLVQVLLWLAVLGIIG